MKNTSVRKLCACAIIAALYAAITILTAPFSYGLVQFRLSEALVVLCALAPSLGIGITLGCFLANLLSPVSALDVAVGTAATLLACLWMSRCRKGFFAVLPNVVCNGLIIGAMLAWVYTPDAFWQGFLVNGLQVAAGELAVMVLLGLPLHACLRRRPDVLARLTGK